MSSRHPITVSERSKLDPFVVATGDASPRDQRDLMERPFFSLAKARRVAPILYEAGDVRVEVHAVPEHGMATIWDADVLIWAASQLVEAENLGLKTSRFLRFTPYQLLIAVGRQTGARDYKLLKGALSRLQSTVIRTTIRNGEHWRRHQFSWINEWEECTTRDGRIEGMEFVLPDWFYRGVIDRSLVLAIDPAYFRLTGGIERDGRRELLRILPAHLSTAPVDGAVEALGTSHAMGIGTPRAALSGLRTHEPQLTLWPETAIPGLNLESNSESNSCCWSARSADKRATSAAQASEPPARQPSLPFGRKPGGTR